MTKGERSLARPGVTFRDRQLIAELIAEVHGLREDVRRLMERLDPAAVGSGAC